MRIRKWIMKQEWRIAQIRGIWSLFYGILLLAYAYFEYIPFFADMGLLGPFAFAIVVFALFIIAGYIYDKVLVMWAASQEVTQERNPYQYVPSPTERIFWFPVYSGLLEAVEKLAEENNADTKAIRNSRKYFQRLNELRPDRKEDIEKAVKLREEFISKHPLSEYLDK